MMNGVATDDNEEVGDCGRFMRIETLSMRNKCR